MKSKKPNPFYINNSQTFRQTLLPLLSKLADNATQKKATEELRDLFINQAQDAERIGIVLSCISDTNEHQKSSTKKELIKVMSILAEVFEDKFLEFLPKVLQIIAKRIRENDSQISVACADTIGSIVSICLRSLPLDQSYKYLTSIFKVFFGVFAKSSKQAQIGAAMCIAKIIQTSPVECLYYMIDEVMHKLIDVMKWPSCKAHLQIMEAMLSLILATEDNPDKLKQHTKLLLPIVIESMANADWNVRKISIEVIYTISVLIPEVLVLHKVELLETLNHLRFDKIKNVRDIAVTTINVVKDIGESEVDDVLIAERDEIDDSIPQETTLMEEGRMPRPSVKGEGQRQNTRARSPKTRLQVNEEFFKNAPKDGQIEIRVKSPPRGHNHLESSAQSSRGGFEHYDPVHNAFVKASPKKEKGERADPTYNNEKFYRGDGVRQALQYPSSSDQDGEMNNKRLISPPRLDPNYNSKQITDDVPAGLPSHPRSRTRSPNKSHYDDPLEQSRVENRSVYDVQVPTHHTPQQTPHQVYAQPQTPPENLDAYHTEMSEIFQQLKHINDQQTNIMSSIHNSQSSTQNEISQLKGRVSYLEDFIEKFYKEIHSKVLSNPIFAAGPNPVHMQPQMQQPPMFGYDPRIQILPQGQTIVYGQPPNVNYSYRAPHEPSYMHNNSGIPNVQPPASAKQNESHHQHQQQQQPYNNTSHVKEPSMSGLNSDRQNTRLTSASKSIDPKHDASVTIDKRRVTPWEEENDRRDTTHDQDHRRDKDHSFFSSDAKRRSDYDDEKIPRILEPTIYENDEDNSDIHRLGTNSARLGNRSPDQATWDRVQNFIGANLLNDAYETCLLEGDEIMLMRLINKTGVVVDQLDLAIIENLLGKIRGLLNNPRYLPTLLLWIERTLDLELQLPKPLIEILCNTLRYISEQNQRESFIDSSVVTILQKTLRVMQKKKTYSMVEEEEQSDYDNAGDYRFMSVDEPHHYHPEEN